MHASSVYLTRYFRNRSLRLKLAEWQVRRQDQYRTESDQDAKNQQLIKDGKAVAQLRKLHREIARRQEKIKSFREGLPDAVSLENEAIEAQERARILQIRSVKALGTACLYKWRALLLRRESLNRRKEARTALEKAKGSSAEVGGSQPRLDEAQMSVIARQEKAREASVRICLLEWKVFTLRRQSSKIKKERKVVCEQAKAQMAELDACRSKFNDFDAQRESLEQVETELEEAQERLMSEV